MKAIRIQPENSIYEELDAIGQIEDNTEAKMSAFKRLEAFRKEITEIIDFDKERGDAMNTKYSTVD